MNRGRCYSVSIGLIGALIACSEAPGKARMTASWTGADSGKVAAQPEVIWCQDDRRLVVTLVREDLGVGLVLYPTESLAAGEFPAFDPSVDTIVRPSAAAGLRWFTEQAIAGYQSDSGGVVLVQDGPRFSGSFGFRLHSIDSPRRIHITGTLKGLTPEPCATDSLPPTRTTG